MVQAILTPNWREIIEHAKQVLKMSDCYQEDVKKTADSMNSVTKGLQEYAFLYISLLLILLSNFYPSGDWSLFISLAIALAVLLFSGWVKKMAEIKINEILVKSGLKDKEIATLKEVKTKLESEIQKLVEMLNVITIEPEKIIPKPQTEQPNQIQ